MVLAGDAHFFLSISYNFTSKFVPTLVNIHFASEIDSMLCYKLTIIRRFFLRLMIINSIHSALFEYKLTTMARCHPKYLLHH